MIVTIVIIISHFGKLRLQCKLLLSGSAELLMFSKTLQTLAVSIRPYEVTEVLINANNEDINGHILTST